MYIATNVISDMLRQKVGPTKSKRKVVEKDQLRYWRRRHFWDVCLKILIRESLFNVKKENWDRNTPSNPSKALGTKLKIRERKGPSRGIIQKWAPHERSPWAPTFGERSHDETFHPERCARKAAWDLAKNIYKLQNSDTTTLFSPIEAKKMPAPTSTRPEEREFAVDSKASMHMMSKK